LNKNGKVRIFIWDGWSWAQKGDDILGEAFADGSGLAIALSSDGSRVVVGAPYNDAGFGEGDNRGHSRVYGWVGSSWVQMGPDIDGETEGDRFGTSVAMSADGGRVAVWAPYNSESGINAGQVGVFEWNGANWEHLGVDIGGEAAYDNDGWQTIAPEFRSEAIALSSGGNRVVIGSAFNDGNGDRSGQVRVFDWNGSTWQQAGSDIDGANAGDNFGASVTVSADGNRIAAGAFRNSDIATQHGQVRVFDWTGDDWIQAAESLSGYQAGEYFGWSVNLSDDGQMLAIGAPSFDGFDRNSGKGGVYGLATLVLENNGADPEFIQVNGPFAFDKAITNGSTFNVSVATEPSGPAQTCIVTNGSGTFSSNDVNDVLINCMTNSYSVGGSASGLEGSGLLLQNNGTDDLSVIGNGGFTLGTAHLDLSSYDVTVASQPVSPSQICAVSNGSGNLDGDDVTDIEISCTTNVFTISGTVSGLVGSGLILLNNDVDGLHIDGNGGFAFSTSLVDLDNYVVTVGSQPDSPSQTCTVSYGSGSVNGTDVNDVLVSCTTNSYKVGGTVSSLNGIGLMLRNNGGDDLAVSGNGSFTFSSQVISGNGYNVTVPSQPINLSQTCTVSNGSETMGSEDVTNVTIDCVTNTFSVGGMVSGLLESGLILQLNDDELEGVAKDRTYTFDAQLEDGSSYSVVIIIPPTDPDLSCTINNSSGTLTGTGVSNVDVSCVDSNLVFDNGFEDSQ